MEKLPILFFLCDGLSDRNIEELKYNTPLSASRHPFIDFLAYSGTVGFLDALTPGYTCGSDTAHLSILGVDPLKYYKGRGILEAMGSYAPLVENDLVFKSSFGYLDTTTNMIIKRGLSGEINFDKIKILIDSLNSNLSGVLLNLHIENNKAEICIKGQKLAKQITFNNKSNFVIQGDFNIKSFIHHAGGFRSIFILRGLGKLHSSECIGLGSNDPCVENMSYLITIEQQETIRSILFDKGNNSSELEVDIKCICEFISFTLLEIINKEFETKDIKNSLFNDIKGENISPVYLTRSASFNFNVPTFEEIHKIKAAMICNTPVVVGVGRMLGLDCFDSVDSFNAKVKDPLSKYGLVFYHFKKTDDFSHSGEWKKKSNEIEKVDKLIKSYLENILCKDPTKDCKVIFTGDHTTPCNVKKHTHDPVPCFITKTNYNQLSAINNIKTVIPKFSEFLYSGKTFGRIRMIDLLSLCDSL